MTRITTAFLAGLLFALGLGVSGMTRPSKVLGFLDVASGAWDPSLLFVMGGAIAVYAPAAWLAKRRDRPLLDDKYHLPVATRLDRPLLVGSAVFGAGWGFGGFCPGPALTGLPTLRLETLVFVAAMIAGMALHLVYTRRQRSSRADQGILR